MLPLQIESEASCSVINLFCLYYRKRDKQTLFLITKQEGSILFEIYHKGLEGKTSLHFFNSFNVQVNTQKDDNRKKFLVQVIFFRKPLMNSDCFFPNNPKAQAIDNDTLMKSCLHQRKPCNNYSNFYIYAI